jgi:hypothetical protein
LETLVGVSGGGGGGGGGPKMAFCAQKSCANWPILRLCGRHGWEFFGTPAFFQCQYTSIEMF